MKKIYLGIIFSIFVFAVAFSQPEKIDTTMIKKIKDEGLNNSKVMETMSWLTDVYGPRLTWSPGYKKAADWAKNEMIKSGLENVHFENFAPVGKGWTLKKFSANIVNGNPFPLIAHPKAWSPGTKGTIKSDLVYFKVDKEEDFEKYKGKLKGAVVLVSEPREITAHFNPGAKRQTEIDLLKLANAAMPTPTPPRQRPQQAQAARQQTDSTTRTMLRGFGMSDSAITRFLQTQALSGKKVEFILQEGALAVFEQGRKGDGGTIFVQQASVPQPQNSSPFEPAANAYSENAPQIIPQVVLASEHYNRLIRMIEKGEMPKVEMDIEVENTKADSGFNVIAEIPGTDLKEEIVMIGAHFDSWHGGTGATDNATGSAVCMEAMRILKKIDAKPRRTIRIGLWGGEEQGLHGSRAYVAKHLGEREGAKGAMSLMTGSSGELKTKPEYEKFSVYFNNDNGTGKVRGVYMQANESARPVFRSWLAPFSEMGATTLTLSNTSGTDHLAFDGIGLPGFQFIQDQIEYDPRTHHSNMDVYDRVQADDLKQAAIIMASFAYNAAMRDEKFPRKPKTYNSNAMPH
ncbi:MAG: M20/M25/M40 family metallo-hydrolase [Bacteroidetes bacterium]|nr:M20/M25/M40 family metallo-hydrolase [Bacteroidota bacterium]